MLHKAQNIALGFFQGNDLFINIYRITSQILCQAESHREDTKVNKMWYCHEGY